MSQKTESDWVYYYEDINFIMAETFEEIDKDQIETLKKENGWNQPLETQKMSRRKLYASHIHIDNVLLKFRDEIVTEPGSELGASFSDTDGVGKVLYYCIVYDMDRNDEAFEILNRVKDKYKNEKLIHSLLAQYHFQEGMSEEAFKEVSDAIIVMAVVILNCVIGMVQEGKARKALESLKKLTSPRAQVIRDGRRKEIPAAQLVTGDLVCLEAGCQVPADLRLIQTNQLKI